MACEDRYTQEDDKNQTYNNENYRFSLTKSILTTNDGIEQQLQSILCFINPYEKD